MDNFTDDDAATFLSKEWLVKIDNARAQPYLFKFSSSTTDLETRSCVLITDTRDVWFEALDLKTLARRWRRLNPGSSSNSAEKTNAEEDVWRKTTHTRLCELHTLKSVQECTFSIEDSRDADMSVEMQLRGCTWRWECNTIGRRIAATVVSSQLVMPLLSIAHLAFSSADPVSELEERDLEQAVDRVARTGRRARDVHVRQTLARPRVATTLRRISAVFNFVDSPPPIISVLNEEDEPGAEDQEGDPGAPSHTHPMSPDVPAHDNTKGPDSATEPEDSDAEPGPASPPAIATTKGSGPSSVRPISSSSSEARPPPPKKAKSSVVPESSGEEAQQKPAVVAMRRNAGVRQPLKRGGRRF